MDGYGMHGMEIKPVSYREKRKRNCKLHSVAV